MRIADVISFLESKAPADLQEHYDNAGLLTGNNDWECKGIMCSLDATIEVIKEAIEKKCNMVVAHHPIVFTGLKKINGKNYVETVIIEAIKNDIAIYAIHTNLDNVIDGVNGEIAKRLNLITTTILSPRAGSLRKLFTFAPLAHADKVRQALFDAGAGSIADYSECSFNVEGTGTFRAGERTNPFIGEIGKRHQEKEQKIEVIYYSHDESRILSALKNAHPYEEVAYDLVPLSNFSDRLGSGIIGELEKPLNEEQFLNTLKTVFGTPTIRHTKTLSKKIKKVALCGGAGSFLISKALAKGADAYVTADIKYHEFFDANDRLLLVDIGHYESEQFTISLLQEILAKKFLTFAVLKTSINTNPVRYY